MTENDPRWIATVIYRSDQGELDNVFLIEELSEIQSIVERGPDWNALDKIEIRLNPRRQNYDVTVEGLRPHLKRSTDQRLKAEATHSARPRRWWSRAARSPGSA